MRSELHHAGPSGNILVHLLAQAVCDITSVFLLIGDLIAARTSTVKKTDHSEPPDVVAIAQAL